MSLCALNDRNNPISFELNSYSLESEFEDYHFIRDVNVDQDTGYNFLEPNEGCPESITAHLARAKKGILVATGSERAFFDLLFCDESVCDGLVILDITPKVKAYVDFNTLLLRISSSREDYNRLSTYSHEKESLNQRIEELAIRIRESKSLPARAKTYYTQHLHEFAVVYLQAQKLWRGGCTSESCSSCTTARPMLFEQCRYEKENALFLKLKKYAEGNIISIVGDISKLSFLKNRNISVVDTSNIWEYCLLNLQGGETFHPRVMWTSVSIATAYHSFQLEMLNERETAKFDELLDKIRVSNNIPNERTLSLFLKNAFSRSFNTGDLFNYASGSFYTKKTLVLLEDLVSKIV